MPRNPKRTKKPKAKAKKPPAKRRPNRVTNQNTVRVHVVNSLGGGEAAPPPYTGPDRGYFTFNPIFDMGTQKQPLTPPMNTGPAISESPVRGRAVEIATQTMISDNRDPQFIKSLARDDLRSYAKELGIGVGSRNKAQLLDLVLAAVA